MIRQVTPAMNKAALEAVFNAATPGDEVEFLSGIYDLGSEAALGAAGSRLELVRVKGTPANHILFRPESGGDVTIKSLRLWNGGTKVVGGVTVPDRDAPSQGNRTNRTVKLQECEYLDWRNLKFEYGVHVTATRFNVHGDLLPSGTGTFGFPGVDTPDEAAFRNFLTNTPSTIPPRVGQKLAPSVAISFESCQFKKRGLYIEGCFDPVARLNTLLDLNQSEGGGIHVHRSVHHLVTANTVAALAAPTTTGSHDFNEAFRQSSWTGYGELSLNQAPNQSGIARGCTEDVGCIYNLTSKNTVFGGDIAFSLQGRSRGSIWEKNIAHGAKTGQGIGHFVYGDSGIGEPPPRQQYWYVWNVIFRCNNWLLCSDESLQVKGIVGCAFERNRIDKAIKDLNSPDLRSGLFGSFGNSWDGSSTLPSNASIIANDPGDCLEIPGGSGDVATVGQFDYFVR